MTQENSHHTGSDFVDRVRRAASHVLGSGETGNAIIDLCDHHEQSCQMILQDRADNATVVAIVGATGQGKSWMTRQLIRDTTVASAIRSGNNLDEATEKLTWIGPRPPADLDSRHERYLACDGSKMQSIGAPYLIVDAPGATDDRRAIAGVAERALSLASVLVLVVRRDQLRSQRVTGLAAASEGTIVIPVVNMAPVQKRVTGNESDDDDLNADIETLVSRLRETAPQSIIESAVVVADFEIDSRTEREIGESAAAMIAQRVESALSESGGGDHRRGTRLAALDARFNAAVASVLQRQLPELTAAIDRLNAEARKLPTQIAGTLLGGATPLRAAIRSRLRLSLLSETAALWFPYRTILSLLNLTHGAWDRVLLSFSGSIPSLVGAVYTGVQNIRQQHETGHDLRNGLRQRASAAVTDRLGPMAARFRSELNRMRSGSAYGSHSSSDTQDIPLATLSGIDALQEQSQAAFDECIDRGSVSGRFVFMTGLIGTAIFWCLMAGPLVALYESYLGASFSTLAAFVTSDESPGGETASVVESLDRFPRPHASMLLTGLLLSLLPTSIFAMIVLSICQGRRRIDAIERSLRDRHDSIIAGLQSSGVLRLKWNDPLLSDAEFLLSIGRTGLTEHQESLE
ncbi:hypothetical protein [Neorhodopirellula pilleata]|uniref:Uncharacterized protein n=1 Tax=Neorhodopirellula pilleata TaxID=2714738 RepID=A0A5C6ARJ2_9BACT|nr:hypothetical protein [Neorhodopirellula pilleata]TWU02101.1 hypothetical protein Pla100_18410 [Neorhodopirellula pilleata]